MASSSADPAGARQKWKYDVFVSFRGEDTRDNFISHLLHALSEKGIDTFVDYKLRKGKPIARALLQAIEESNVAVVVFSKGYASSTWCLDELVRIMECHETHGQIVVPVFYHVDPSDVRKQTGSFARPFAKVKTFFCSDKVKYQKWKTALTKAANLCGWDSKIIREERTLVDRIVEDVLEKLKQALPIGFEHLVDIDSRIEEIKKVLAIGLQDVRILGIWGMGGVGKTTIAEAIFSQMSCEFEGCCFLNNVREEWDKCGMKKLLEDLISKTLGDRAVKIDTSSIGPGSFYTRRLSCKRILIVLDDVDNALQLNSLVGDPCWFGPGSRIIVTSRDRNVFERRVDYIYEVKGLDDNAALRLFNQNAFKQSRSTKDRTHMSNLVLRYSQGNPLALKVLGSFLYGKNNNEWESAMNELKKVPIREIQDVLRISYDGLNRREKEIFLHIACFFKGEEKDIVMQMLNSCGFSADIGIRVLIDRSLVTISSDGLSELEMHDLLQEMGREIVREESKEPGKRSRLWDPEDICQVLKKNEGTEKVEAMYFNMRKIGEIHLNPKAFENMSNLKFLKFYNSEDFGGLEEEECHVQLPQGLDFLPNELRYLYWHGYPLEYLPANFHPENLLLIQLPHSNVKGLRKEAEVQTSWVRDRYFTDQKVAFDFLINDTIVLFHYVQAEKIVNHLSPFSPFSKVTCVRLVNSKKLTSLPNNIDMKCLDTLDLSGCSRLETFPEISMNTKYLYLDDTAVKEVPPYVGCLVRLVKLSMGGCTKLNTLSANICKLRCLEEFNLGGCSKLKKFPEILEAMDNLTKLNLNGTAIEELPSSVDNLKGLQRLFMKNCRNLAFLPQSFGNLKSLHMFLLSIGSNETLKLEGPSITKSKGHGRVGLSLPPWSDLTPLNHLSLADCNLWQLPDDLGRLSSLEILDLSGNNFEAIPESIKQLSQLDILDIKNCQCLKSLPELPSRLRRIFAQGCTQLDRISSLNRLLYQGKYPEYLFDFSNCSKLDGNEGSGHISLLRNRHFVNPVKLMNSNFGHLTTQLRVLASRPFVKICYPGNRIPEWFRYQSLGDPIKIRLPTDWLESFSGFLLCVVLEDSLIPPLQPSCHFGYICDYKNENLTSVPYSLDADGIERFSFRTEHVIIWNHVELYYMMQIQEYYRQLSLFFHNYDALIFNFPGSKVKKCGVTPF